MCGGRRRRGGRGQGGVGGMRSWRQPAAAMPRDGPASLKDEVGGHSFMAKQMPRSAPSSSSALVVVLHAMQLDYGRSISNFIPYCGWWELSLSPRQQ